MEIAMFGIWEIGFSVFYGKEKGKIPITKLFCKEGFQSYEALAYRKGGKYLKLLMNTTSNKSEY